MANDGNFGYYTGGNPGPVTNSNPNSNPAPQPPAGSYVINPGSVYQTYNPAIGQTTYPNAPASFVTGALPTTNGINYGISTPGAPNGSVVPGVAPTVQTPTGIPNNTQVFQPNGKYADVKVGTELGLPSESVSDKAGTIVGQKEKQNIALQKVQENLANPSLLNKQANDAFIQGAIMAKFGRSASKEELGLVAGSPFNLKGLTVSEVAKKIGLQTPPGNIPGSNPGSPDTNIPADQTIGLPDGTIDPVKMMAQIETDLKGINDLIAQEREAFDTSVLNIGNQPGVAMPLIQGQQAYQNNLKEVRLNRLLDEKKAVLDSADIKMKVYDYARQLRQDQQQAMGSIISTFLSAGVPISDSLAQQYSKLTGINAQALVDGFAVATANWKAEQLAKNQPSISDQLNADTAGYDIKNGNIVSKPTVQEPITSVPQDGTIGGQCGDYTHKVADNIPTMGDTWESKMKIANMSTGKYSVGDMLIQKTRMPYGHVSIVTAVNGNEATVTESNWNGDEKVGTRVIKMGDPTVTGVYRGGTLKQPSQVQVDGNSSSILNATGLSMPAFSYLTQGTSALTRMTADMRIKYMTEAEKYINKATGTDVATFQSQYSALGKTVEANSLRNNQAGVAEQELNATLQNIQSAAQEAKLGNLSKLNIAKIWTGQQLNDPNASTFKFHLSQLREEFAMYNMALAGQLDANGNIRQINESDYKRADDIIQSGFATGSIDGFAKALEASRSKMQTVLKTSIDAQNKQVWKLFGVGDKYKAPTSSNSGSSSYEDYLKAIK